MDSEARRSGHLDIVVGLVGLMAVHPVVVDPPIPPVVRRLGHEPGKEFDHVGVRGSREDAEAFEELELHLVVGQDVGLRPSLFGVDHLVVHRARGFHPQSPREVDVAGERAPEHLEPVTIADPQRGDQREGG